MKAGLRLLPLGAVPLLIAPRSGAMADRTGPRPLVLVGLILQAGGIAALALLGTPHRPYLALVGPLLLVSLGLTLAIPALTKSVVSSVAPGDITIASGLFTTLRQLGGAFGVAAATAAFTSAGSYGSPASVATGYDGAMYLAALIGALGVFTALGVQAPRQRRPPRSGRVLGQPASGRGTQPPSPGSAPTKGPCRTARSVNLHRQCDPPESPGLESHNSVTGLPAPPDQPEPATVPACASARTKAANAGLPQSTRSRRRG